ncbi:MAG: haloacid dehalogenase-like hydrolase [Alphaproteobacteria bacterium]|nr:haloacid dehalogenase-like hydrolase [Alphaproteobacteria bacterium]
MAKKVNVVVFDFDGTLSASDSNFEFGKYCFGHSVRAWVFLPLFLLGMLMHLLNKRSIWARQIMRCFVTPNMVKKFAPIVIARHKKNRFGWAAAQVAKERAAGNICLLVSASPDYLIPGLVDDMEFDAVISSQMETKHPWKYKFLCWGPNKVVALKKWAARHDFIPHVVRAYGDSDSDKYIMALADTPVWINRKTGLPK